MGDKKGKAFNKDDKKIKPSSVANDQLGENSGEGRISKDTTKGGKCR